MTSEVSLGRTGGGFLRHLRAAALTAVLAAAAGSIGLMLRAGHRNPSRLLLVIIAVWVLSPFMLLILADLFSARWALITRTTLYGLMLFLAVGSLAVYVDDALRPRKAQAAFVFIALPPASWLLIAIVVPAAALISGGKSRTRHTGVN